MRGYAPSDVDYEDSASDTAACAARWRVRYASAARAECYARQVRERLRAMMSAFICARASAMSAR